MPSRTTTRVPSLLDSGSGLSRRRFLELSLGAGSALALGCAGAAVENDAAPPPPGACDAHIHLWSANQRAFPRAPRYQEFVLKPRRYETRDFLAMAAKNGVDRAVAIQAPCYAGDHTYLLSVLASRPGRFAGVGTVDFADDPAAALREQATLGLRGTRISVKGAAMRWPDPGTVSALFEASADLAMPLCMLTGPESFQAISDVCARHPKTSVILDHAGRLAPGVQTTARERDLDALSALAEHPNVYVKISGFHMLGRPMAYATDVLPIVYRTAADFGPQRLLWGSDAPQQLRNDHSYDLALELIRGGATDLSEDDRQWILHKTAEKLFFPELAERSSSGAP